MSEKIRVVLPVMIHPIKAAIWRLGSTGQIESSYTLRKIGEMVGEEHPQQIKHHLDGLVKMGAINFINGNYQFPVGNQL